ncbi:hypothetical protein DFQ28_004288 [Apophysomyces sp. BC1034]|nr:hypothetical protein DFQ30_011116 [Apophysomyces sp. BC1015]KAG0176399.1 hypothetical protein DFQ29_006185 [Apophysomyces sp. BC1021]KAG0193621.1 hypothetical protein DFQ28_004288 [Apophysomyces sp. BC1034]
MATLERQPRQRQSSRRSTNISEDEAPAATSTAVDTTDPVLETLMREPVEYDDLEDEALNATMDTSCQLSSEVVQSLQSVKRVCLIALDSLLRHIVTDSPDPAKNREIRRLSDSTLEHRRSLIRHGDLLESIARNTNRITHATSGILSMKRSESWPALATLSGVQRLLHSHQFWLVDVSNEYNLCCALAALLNDVYRILELAQQAPEDDNAEQDADSSNVYNKLRESVSIFQRDRAAGLMAVESDTSKEMTELWSELDRLMDAVHRLAHDRLEAPPPAYDDHSHEIQNEKPPPGYDLSMRKDRVSSTAQSEKTQRDLDNLLSAIDRLSDVAPRLNNQRVALTDRQASEMAAAAVGKVVERLSRGRMDNQRATLPSLTAKQDMLRNLVAQIHQSASRTLDNQRVPLSGRLQKKMEAASVNGLLDKIDRGRLTDQDWTSPEQRLLQDLTTMTDLLAQSLHRPRLSKQRYSLSALKERDLFINSLFKKVDRLEGRRMTNQDAERPKAKGPRGRSATSPSTSLVNNPEAEAELIDIFNHIHKSKLQLDNQRASFTGPSPLASFQLI